MFFKRPSDWRKKWSRLPSAWQLACIVTVSWLAALGLLLAVARWSVRRDLNEMARRRMAEELLEYAALYNKGGLPAVSMALSAGLDEGGKRIVRVTAADGEALLESDVPGVDDYSWETLLPFFLDPNRVDWHILKHSEKPERLVVGRIGLEDGKRLWYARVDGEELAATGGIVQRLLVVGVVLGLFILVPLAWLIRHVLQPLHSLTKAAHRLAADPGRARVSAPTAIPELKEFAAAYNTSLERIATLTRELHSVNEHLAHELRTPLARIRGNLENLLDHYGEAEGEEAAVMGIEEIDRATHLVQSILTIRLGDSGVMRLHLELTSPFELICDLVQLYAPAAEERGLTIEYECESDGFVLLDRQRVRQAITNLLDNALAYTPSGGHITLLQLVNGDGFLLRVQDTGPGLTASDLEKIWRRFARGSAASARTPGTGIGLALVKAVARAHFGDAGAHNRPEGGSEFWIKLPLTPEVGERPE